MSDIVVKFKLHTFNSDLENVKKIIIFVYISKSIADRAIKMKILTVRVLEHHRKDIFKKSVSFYRK